MALSKIKGTVIADDAINADRIADGTVVASDLLDNTITGAKLATDIAISTSGNITTTGAFTSTGIDDNATSTAITIDSNEVVRIGNTSDTYSPTYTEHMVIGNYNADEDHGITFLSDLDNTFTLGFADDGHSTLRGAIKYSHLNDFMTFHAFADSERMRITKTGNVGIGTSSPDAMLHIHDAGASTSTHSYTKLHIENDDHSALQFSGSTLGEQWIWFSDDTTATPVGGITYYHGGPYMGFRVEGSERMRIDSSGDVGIGTSSPATILELASTTNNNVITFDPSNGGSNDDILGGIDIENDGSVGRLTVRRESSSTSGYMKFETRSTGGALTEHMRISGSGKVGIGKSSPNAKLHVDDSGGGNVFITRTSTNQGIYFEADGTNGTVRSTSSTGSLLFQTNGNNERMRIDSSGNVGIGTSSPNSPLTVESTTSTSTIRSKADVNTIGTQTGLTFQTGAWGKARIFAESKNAGNSGGVLIFGVGSGVSLPERMRINDSGNVLVNATSSVGTGKFQASLSTSGFCSTMSSPGNQADYIQFHNGSEVGSIVRSGGSGVAYNTSSDYRLKENVSYDFDATTRLKQLKPARFNFIGETDRTVDGFLAHEVSSIVPEAISGEKDAVQVWQEGEELPEGVSVGDNKLDENGNTIPEYQGIDQSKLVPLLVKTIQELEARITALENQP